MAMQYRFSSVVVGVMVALGAASMAARAEIVTTLPTSAIDANTNFSFSSKAITAMKLLDINASALGNTTNIGGSPWSFNLPVTEVTTAIGLLPPSLTPVSGRADGSGLRIGSADGALVLANFALDFKRNVLSADFTTSAGTVKGMDVYSFHVKDGLHLSTSGGLSMKMSMDQMFLTSGARAAFIDALALPDFTDAVMAKLDFGTMAVDISPMLRSPVNDRLFKPTLAAASLATPVPEAPSMAAMLLGLFGVALVSRRARASTEFASVSTRGP